MWLLTLIIKILFSKPSSFMVGLKAYDLAKTVRHKPRLET